MTDKLSIMWTSLAPAIGNHLWQSTLVALVAGAFTLLLRSHHARLRYWLWLAASVKFLVPFSLLITLGSFFAWQPRHALRVKTPQVYYTLEEISQPFTQRTMQAAAPHALSPASPTLTDFAPWLALVWLAGVVAVLVFWIVRWRRIGASMKLAAPSPQGRELEALRRVERTGGLRKPIALFLSRTSMEPGIFGVAHPVLIWPEGISRHLHDDQLEAILAHEVWHVRRRDNLYATFHMLVEAIFWFYPLVWWLGSRLVDERERACDEEVVASGSDRHVYAESILKVCEFCLGSPLPCVAGVTGADLKKRMVHIMNDRILHKLDFARKLLLTAATFLVFAVPVTFGLFRATPGNAQSPAMSSNSSGPVFSSVSIKPHESADPMRTKMMFSMTDGSFIANGVILQRLIQMAYHVEDAQISGPSDLLSKPKFDIETRLDPSYAAAMRQQTTAGKNVDDQNILKSLLADRFKLVAHFETRTMPSYDLVPDESGTKLQASTDERTRMMRLGQGELSSSGAPIELLTAQLSARLGRPVVDKTGLQGNYAFNLHWTPDATENENLKESGEPIAMEPPTDANGPSLETALREQLGLKLVPNNGRVQVLVIDHAEVPSEN